MTQKFKQHSLCQSGLLLLSIGMLFFLAPIKIKAQSNPDTQAQQVGPSLAEDLKAVPALEQLQGQFITDVIADYSGKVWIATLNSGIWVYDPFAAEGMQWTEYKAGTGLAQNEIKALVLDRHGRIWAAHPRLGVSVFQGKSWKNLGPTDGPLGAHVTDLMMNRANGDVWMSTEMGLSRYRPKGSFWNHYGRPEGLHESTLNAVAFDRRANVFVVTRHGRLIRGDAKSGYLAWTELGAVLFKDAGLQDLMVMRDGSLVVRGKRGLWKSDRKLERWTQLISEAPVFAMAMDARGRIWAGLKGELQLIERNGSVRKIALGQDEIPTVMHFPLTGGLVIGLSKGLRLLLPKQPKQYRSVTTESWPDPDSGLDPRDLKRMQGAVANLESNAKKLKAPAAHFLGEDWQTRGFWLGRYGNARALPMWRFLDEAMSRTAPELGEVEKNYVVIRNLWSQPGPWILKTEAVDLADQSALWMPLAQERRRVVGVDTAFHDRDQKHFRFRLQLDQGPWKLALYLMDAGVNHSHDITIHVYPYHPIEEEALKSEALLSHRLSSFGSGVYVNLLLMGAGDYIISLEANDKKNVLLQGIFIDQLNDLNTPRQAGMLELLAARDIEMSEPPARYYDFITKVDESLSEYTRVWRGMRRMMDRERAYEMYYPWSKRLHRQALQVNFPNHIKFTWRYQTGVLGEMDIKFFEDILIKSPETIPAEAVEEEE